ncbi:glycosyltransferase family A protein, partial [Vibrio breoganii]
MNFVSVIIPTFKRSDLLKNTIDSVLNQTYPYFEIIVVDDNEASSSYRKKTELLMSQYSLSTKIKYLKNEKNCGGSASRNNGVLASTGDFICFLDDDDTFHATKLEKQMSIMLSKDKTWGAVYCNYNFVSKNKIIRKTEHQEEGNLLFDM